MRIHSSVFSLFSVFVLVLTLGGCMGGGGGSSGSDTVAPTVSAVTPAKGASNAAPGSDLRVTFSEAMDCASLDAGSFKVSDAGSTPIQGSITCSGSSATFASVFGGLPEGATVNATITTSASDAAGNALAADYHWSFTTRARAWSTADLVLQGSDGIDPPLVRYDGHGNAFAVWRDNGVSVKVSRFTASGGWTTTNVSGITDLLDGARLYVAPSGNAVVAWYQRDVDGNYQVWSSTYSVTTGAWAPSTTLIDNPADGGSTGYIGLAGDADGNAMVVWERDYATPATKVLAAYYNGSSWSAATVVDDALTANAWGDPAVAFVGNEAVALWEQSDGINDKLWYSRYTPGSGWVSATVVDTGSQVPMDVRLAAAPDGQMMAVWQENGGSGFGANHYDAGSGNWGTPSALEATTNGIGSYDLAMNAAGNVLVVWVESDGTADRIWFRAYDAARDTWGFAAAIDNDLSSVSNPHLAMDPQGNAVATWEYYDATDGVTSVAARRYVGGAWAAGANPVTRLETNPNDAYNHGIGMDNRGNAMAVWRTINGVSGKDDLRWSVLQ
jgi:hypothetical protein